MRSIPMRLAAFALALLFPALAARAAHAAAGSIRGHVLGPDGRAVPGATVKLRNDITGFEAETTTGADGAYQFFNVPFNPYEIHAELQGFEPVHRPV
ncbi:MAG TPA: carboxypeptidase-like regulatory domain-containing protein, partial [Vicinamibacteria bacterium]|nr:carboxypeptidase-like regulatory domain-containing protein [Vicinamibacteria bacterium]